MDDKLLVLNLSEDEEMILMKANPVFYDLFSTNTKYNDEAFRKIYDENGMAAEDILPYDVFYEFLQEDLANTYRNYEPYPEAYDEDISKEYAGKRISFTK